MAIFEIPVFQKDLPKAYLDIRKQRQQKTREIWKFVMQLCLTITIGLNIGLPSYLYFAHYSVASPTRLFEAVAAMDAYLLPLFGITLPLFYLKEVILLAYADSRVKKDPAKAVRLLRRLAKVNNSETQNDVKQMKMAAVIVLTIFATAMSIQFLQGARSVSEYATSMQIFFLSGVMLAYYLGRKRMAIINRRIVDAKIKRRQALLNDLGEASKIAELPDYFFSAMMVVAWVVLYALFVGMINALDAPFIHVSWIKAPLLTSSEVLNLAHSFDTYMLFIIGGLAGLAYFVLPRIRTGGWAWLIASVLTFGVGYILGLPFFSDGLDSITPDGFPEYVMPVGFALSVGFATGLLGSRVEKRLANLKIIKSSLEE